MVKFKELYESVQKQLKELEKAAGDDKKKQMLTIGQKIHFYRIKNKLTQDELARRLGVGRIQVIRWEQGNNIPSPIAVRLLEAEGIIEKR